MVRIQKRKLETKSKKSKEKSTEPDVDNEELDRESEEVLAKRKKYVKLGCKDVSEKYQTSVNDKRCPEPKEMFQVSTVPPNVRIELQGICKATVNGLVNERLDDFTKQLKYDVINDVKEKLQWIMEDKIEEIVTKILEEKLPTFLAEVDKSNKKDSQSETTNTLVPTKKAKLDEFYSLSKPVDIFEKNEVAMWFGKDRKEIINDFMKKFWNRPRCLTFLAFKMFGSRNLRYWIILKNFKDTKAKISLRKKDNEGVELFLETARRFHLHNVTRTEPSNDESWSKHEKKTIRKIVELSVDKAVKDVYKCGSDSFVKEFQKEECWYYKFLDELDPKIQTDNRILNEIIPWEHSSEKKKLKYKPMVKESSVTYNLVRMKSKEVEKDFKKACKDNNVDFNDEEARFNFFITDYKIVI